MRIGLDLDQVVYDQVGSMRDWMLYKHGSEDSGPLGNDFGDGKAYRWFYYRDWKLYGRPMEDDDFVREMHESVNAEHMFLVGALLDPLWPSVIADWLALGHDVHLITDRAWGNRSKTNTEAWLTHNGIQYTGLHFVKDKTIVGCDVLIDDKPSNIEAWEATDRYAIVWDQPWNHGSNIDGGYRGGAIRVWGANHAASAVRTVEAWLSGREDRPGAEQNLHAAASPITVTFDAPWHEVSSGDDLVEKLLAEVRGTRDARKAEMADDEREEAMGVNVTYDETILQEAQRLVHGNRGADYGHPADDFARTAGMWSALWREKLRPGVVLDAADVPMAMICLKLSREQNRPKRDNITDMAGYAETLAMVREREVEDDQRRFELGG